MNGQERLAEQSRAWLTEALFVLLQQENYNEITVKKIAEQAQLSRRTFYRSFKNKDELLNYYSDQLIQKYLNQPDLFIKICKIPIKHMLHAFDRYFAFSPFKCTKRASALV